MTIKFAFSTSAQFVFSLPSVPHPCHTGPRQHIPEKPRSREWKQSQSRISSHSENSQTNQLTKFLDSTQVRLPA